MRSLIISFVVFLSACNGSTTTQVPYSDPALVAQVNNLTKALAAATHEDAQRFAKLQLIGNVKGVTSDLRMQGEFRAEAQVTGVNFGPCADMGVMVGISNPDVGAPVSALESPYQQFKQCTGYYYGVPTGGGAIETAFRIFFDGPNCTGNMFEWPAAGFGYSTQVLSDGVVFTNPVDQQTVLMVQAGQNPPQIQVQSIFIQGACQVDQDVGQFYSVTPNDVSVSGIPNMIPKYQLASP